MLTEQKLGKVVLAYSGGLDTTVCLHWLKEQGWEVITLTVDLGEKKDLDQIQKRALESGATAAYVIDAQQQFLEHFAWPTLQAGAVYEKEYPLATAIARPLIAALLVQVARQEGAGAIAHGCTGKGNDQVRFDVATAAIAPELQVIAPVRDWKMNREEEIEYAKRAGLEIKESGSEFSVDQNLWGRSIECGALEDPWAEPPAAVYEWTNSPTECPDEPRVVEIGFEKGIPVSLDGQQLGAIELVEQLNAIGGEHGVGRIDLIENRLVGIKSREIYEAPAAVILLQAHQALEALTLTKEMMRFKEQVAGQWAQLVFDGLWFSPLREALHAFVAHSQQFVSGEVRIKLVHGSSHVVGRKSENQLYRTELATYGSEDQFDQQAAVGFIKLWGMGIRTVAQVQGQLAGVSLERLAASEVKRLAALQVLVQG